MSREEALASVGLKWPPYYEGRDEEVTAVRLAFEASEAVTLQHPLFGVVTMTFDVDPLPTQAVPELLIKLTMQVPDRDEDPAPTPPRVSFKGGKFVAAEIGDFTLATELGEFAQARTFFPEPMRRTIPVAFIQHVTGRELLLRMGKNPSRDRILASVVSFARFALRECALHEIDEMLHVDRIRIFDPHSLETQRFFERAILENGVVP